MTQSRHEEQTMTAGHLPISKYLCYELQRLFKVFVHELRNERVLLVSFEPKMQPILQNHCRAPVASP